MKIEAEKAKPVSNTFLEFSVARMVVIRIIKTANSHGFIASTKLPTITAAKVRFDFCSMSPVSGLTFSDWLIFCKIHQQ